jgi:Group 4 capsule polysaccharide lipoprotein gfcB, YjbF
MVKGLGMMITLMRLHHLFRRPVFLALFVPLFLAACSGGNEEPDLELQVIASLRTSIAAKTAPQVESPPVTRALLDTLDGAYLEVRLERRDLLAFLTVNAQLRDGTPGQITVWRTVDNSELVVRNGVLIATRGLGGDILSSTVQVDDDTPGPAGSGEKIMTIRALDNKAIRLALVCELSDLGPETIEIIELRHPTRHLRETCTGGVAADGTGTPGRVVNDYWVDSRNGLVWQSRQWAGPQIGYLRLRQITQ